MIQSRMFRELASLGNLSVSVSIDKVPDLESIEPDDCYLSWELEISGDISKEQIDEVFDWVDGDCDLSIEAVIAESDPVATDDNNKQAEAPPLKDVAKPDRREGNERRKKAKPAESSSIRVGIDKIDTLINMVGELVITQSMLGQIGADIEEETINTDRIERLVEGLQQLERNTRELQEAVMQIRMLPISFAI